MGTAWVQCSCWVLARVRLFKARLLQCYSCLEKRHVQQRCTPRTEAKRVTVADRRGTLLEIVKKKRSAMCVRRPSVYCVKGQNCKAILRGLPQEIGHNGECPSCSKRKREEEHDNGEDSRGSKKTASLKEQSCSLSPYWEDRVDGCLLGGG
ncbi:hypothetical protein P5V15_002868 [Pogonomyrmex californicus]